LPSDNATAKAASRVSSASLAKFDGEFASTAQTYAGSGTLRYTW
jgi:hypothetical protein